MRPNCPTSFVSPAILPETRIRKIIMISEFLPLLDEHANMTPYFVDRDFAHTHGKFHPTAHIWVLKLHPVRILLQQRAFTKDSYPGQWDMSASGHVVYKDTIRNTAIRELREELGIHAHPYDLKRLGSFVHHTIGVFHGKPWNDRESVHVFLYITDEDFIPHWQKEEIETCRWTTPDELQAMLHAANDAPNHKKLCTLEQDVHILLNYLKNVDL